MNFRFLRQGWFQLLLGGGVLFFGAEQALKLTRNPNLLPTVIILGAFVVPVSFVAYFYGQERVLDRGRHGGTPLNVASLCFLVGGAIGVIVAGVLEFQTLARLGVLGLFEVGVIEEAAKLIFPLAIYLRARYRSPVDGLLFGTASGMGFAALETMGYGLVALIRSQGSIGALEEVLLVRGLLSPVGHAAWTGLVCAVLWSERQRGYGLFTPAVMGALLLAVALHTLWNLAGLLQLVILVFPGYLVIGGISLALLIRQMRRARRVSPPDVAGS